MDTTGTPEPSIRVPVVAGIISIPNFSDTSVRMLKDFIKSSKHFKTTPQCGLYDVSVNQARGIHGNKRILYKRR